MRIFIITFRSVTFAQRGERLLNRNNHRCVLQRTPKWMEQQGCGYSLRIKTEDIIPAVELLREMKSDGKLLYHEKASVEFLDDRIVETCEQGETVVKYSDIVNVYEEKGYIYIFYGAMQAFILPERCFGDNEIREIKNKLSQSGVRA